MWALTLALVALAAGGCTAVVIAGKVATTTVGVAADVTAAAVRGTGKVASAVVGAGGDVADEGIRTAGKLSKSGVVVFLDPRSGAVFETPWTPGLNLAAAAASARVAAGFSALRVIRAGKAIGAAGPATKLVLKSGDVVEGAR